MAVTKIAEKDVLQRTSRVKKGISLLPHNLIKFGGEGGMRSLRWSTDLDGSISTEKACDVASPSTRQKSVRVLVFMFLRSIELCERRKRE